MRILVGRKFTGQPFEKRIVQHFGDTAVMGFRLSDLKRPVRQYFEALMGLNIAALLRGIQSGPRALGRASRAAYSAAGPVMMGADGVTREQVEQIPVQNLDDLLGDKQSNIMLRVMKYEDGMMPRHDAIAFLSLLVAEKPSQVLEIGTFMGHTTRAIAENLETAIVHTVDLPLNFSNAQTASHLPPKDDFHLIARRIVGREFKGQSYEKRIVQHFGDTAVMDFSQLGQPTFFFIDGSHTHEYCKSDSEKCLSLCPQGGTFLWHDCNRTHPGVIRLILEWRALGRNIVRIDDTDLAYWKSN